MRLIDQIAAGHVRWPLDGFAKSPATLSPTEVHLRYVLDEEVSRICDKLIREHFEMLADMIELVKLPSQTFWIERLSEFPDENGGFSKLGILVEADEGCRSGELILFAEMPDSHPLIMPQKIVFDFDHSISGCDDITQFQAPLRDKDDLPQKTMSEHFAIKLHEGWDQYYNIERQPIFIANQIIADLCHSLWDGLFLMAFSVLLASQRSFREVPRDFSKLNKARKHKGKAELCDFIEVKQSLFEKSGAARATFATNKQSPRMHIVRGHFVRRGTILFWRRTHFRGDAEKIVRTRTVRLSA